MTARYLVATADGHHLGAFTLGGYRALGLRVPHTVTPIRPVGAVGPAGASTAAPSAGPPGPPGTRGGGPPPFRGCLSPVPPPAAASTGLGGPPSTAGGVRPPPAA